MKFCLIFVLFLYSINSKIADHKPFCLFPNTFHTTIQPLNKQINLELFSGQWYEIVRGPSATEYYCICTESQYLWDKSKNLLNMQTQCLQKDGSQMKDSGKAKSLNQYNTYLKENFFWGFNLNYFILNIDDNYKWVLAGEPCRDHFWILSRQPTLDNQILQEQLNLLKSLNFDITKAVYRSKECPMKTLEY